MRKMFSVLGVVLLMVVLSACGDSGNDSENVEADDDFFNEMEEEMAEEEQEESQAAEHPDEIMSLNSEYDTFYGNEDDVFDYMFEIKERYISGCLFLIQR